MAKAPTTGIAPRIIEAREALGLSTAQLARRLGVQTKTLSRWERGKTEPRSSRLVNLAGVLNVSPAWLLSGRGDSPVENGSAHELLRLRVELDQLTQNLAHTLTSLQEVSARLRTLETTH